MVSRRETIEALLRVKDLARFKTSMKSAGSSVKEFGHEVLGTAEMIRILEKMDRKLEEQSIATALALRGEARATNDAGDEARQTAVEMAVLGREMKELRKKTIGQIPTWQFWKDRLSLTSAEVKSTAITMGSYLSPALLQLGISAGGAMIGGAIVGGGGIAALIVGLGGLGIIAKTVFGQITKIKSAQNAYNVAIQQYGKTSKQAQTAADHLYAVIQTQGGAPVWRAVKAMQALGKSWSQMTLGARSNLANILTSTISGAQRLLPTFAKQTNLSSFSFAKDWAQAMRSLSGNDTKKTITMLSVIFRQISGPLLRGAVNLFMALGRVLRNTGPWLERLANAWERWTFSLRKSSADQPKVVRFISEMIAHTSAWWRLLKDLSKTIVILFSGTQKSSLGVVNSISKVIEKFNAWLDFKKRTGEMQRFFAGFDKSLGLLFTHPIKWFNQYSPIIMKYITKAVIGATDIFVFEFAKMIPRLVFLFAKAAGTAAVAFVKGFLAAPILSKLFLLGFLFKSVIFKAIGLAAAGVFGRAFVRSAGETIAARFGFVMAGEQFAASAALSGAAAGSRFGLAFTRAFRVLAIPAIAIALQNAIDSATGNSDKSRSQVANALGQNDRGTVGDISNFFTGTGKKVRHFFDQFNPFKAQGGIIPWGTSGIVGDAGPEIASSHPGGMQITPLNYGGQQQSRSRPPSLSVSDMLPPIHVHVMVEKKEIGKAYVEWRDERKSRRGELP